MDVQVTARSSQHGHTVDMSTTPCPLLPSDITVFERGWLSSNNVLLDDGETAVLIDTGYCTHAEQTLALVAHALGERLLDHVLNTHLHSDHCGGNGALQARSAKYSVLPGCSSRSNPKRTMFCPKRA